MDITGMLPYVVETAIGSYMDALPIDGYANGDPAVARQAILDALDLARFEAEAQKRADAWVDRIQNPPPDPDPEPTIEFICEDGSVIWV